MKRVTAFIGSPRKRATYQAVQEFEKNLKSYGEIEFEYVFLKDYKLEFCTGCCLCFDKGEEFCPLQDDRDVLLEKLYQSDGVVFATPSYSFQVTAPMKNLLDRMAFCHHRPRFFDKTFTAIVTYGIYGGDSIVKYLESMGQNFGFKTTRGCSLMTLEPRTESQQAKISEKISQVSRRFFEELMSQRPMPPSFMQVFVFRLSRTAIKLLLDENWRDYRYYKEKGWLESGYYYDVKLGFGKKLAGRLSDYIGKSMVKRRS